MIRLKKTVWIHRPEKVRINSSHSLTFNSAGEHHLVWTSDEDDRIVFDFNSSAVCGISLIFSIDQGLRLYVKDNKVILDFNLLDIRTHEEWPSDGHNRLVFERKGETISFFQSETYLYSFTFKSLGASYSVGFFSRGEGKTTFSFS